MSMYNDSFEKHNGNSPGGITDKSFGSRGETIYGLNGRRKVNPLVSDDDDDDDQDDDNHNHERTQTRHYDNDLEFDDTKLETPRSFRHENSTRYSTKYSTKRTTMKIPLKTGDEEHNQKLGTPTVMERLTKYRSRNGTPLRPNLGSEEKLTENSNLIDKAREDTLIKLRKLISDDNKFSPNDSSTKLFKSVEYPQKHHNDRLTTRSSPTRINSRSFDEMGSHIQSPPSNLKIRPFDFDKLNQEDNKNNEKGKKRKLFFERGDVKKTSSSPPPPPPPPIAPSTANTAIDNSNFDAKYNSRKDDVEFDSSDDDNPDKVDKISMKPQVDNSTSISTSPRIDIPVQLAPQPQPPPQTRTQDPVGLLPQTQSSLSFPHLQPQIHSHVPMSEQSQIQPQTQRQSRLQNQSSNPQPILSNQIEPDGLDNNLNNLASSVDIDSVSTNGIGLDKGSLNVGMPSRLDLDSQQEMQRLETLERINVDVRDNGTTRLSMNKDNKDNGSNTANNNKPNVNKPMFQINEMNEMNEINNAMDLESDISSDDNPAELLNELNSFLPNRSSPTKKSDKSPTHNSGTYNSKISNYSNYESSSKRRRNNNNRSSLGNNESVNGSAKYKPIPPPEMTPIRKHYSRLSDKYARHILNKKQMESPKKLEPPVVTTNKPWTTNKWHLLNKLLMSDISIDDIINSNVVVKRLECNSKQELKQRVEFLIKFNQVKKMNRRLKRNKLL